MTFSIEAALDNHVATLEEERQPDGYWHPSSLFSCARKAVYEFTGAAKAPLDKRSKRVFRLGHIFHEFLQAAIGRSSKIVTFYAEVKVVDPIRLIKGHVDGLAFMEDGSVEAHEIKSIGTYGFKALTEPKADHRKQIRAYVRILRKFGGTYKITNWDDLSLLERNTLYPEVHWPTDPEEELLPFVIIPPLGDLVTIRFAYVSKDDMTVKEYVDIYTEEDAVDEEEYLDRLSLHAFEGTLPRRLVNITPTGRTSITRPFECNYCPFATQCYLPSEGEGIA